MCASISLILYHVRLNANSAPIFKDIAQHIKKEVRHRPLKLSPICSTADSVNSSTLERVLLGIASWAATLEALLHTVSLA